MNWGLDTNYDDTGLTIGFQSWIVRTINRINAKSLGATDNYTTGTWTPSLGGTATYTTQTGTYTRIGRMVFLQGRLTVNLIGTGSTTMITGLPYPSTATAGGAVSYWGATVATFVFLACNTTAGASTVSFTAATAATATLTSPATVFQNGTDILFSVAYYV